ncbi:hypothetical protein APR12_001358 [Nocardia amikacinitolerans]|nr:hypothetical protein [Nocardia amikacinitolerans]
MNGLALPAARRAQPDYTQLRFGGPRGWPTSLDFGNYYWNR